MDYQDTRYFSKINININLLVYCLLIYHFTMPNDATAPNERAIAACSWLENLKTFSLLFFDSAQFLEKINAQLVLHRYFLVHRGNFVQNMQHSITITVFLVGDEYKLVEKDLGFNFPSPTREVRGGENSTEATFE